MWFSGIFTITRCMNRICYGSQHPLHLTSRSYSTFRSMTKPSEMAISTIFGEQAVTADRFTGSEKENNRCSLTSVSIGQI